MLLTYKSTSAGHPLIKNANGTLRLGRWWFLYPDVQYFTSSAVTNATYYSASLVSGAVSGAKTAGAWTTRTSVNNTYHEAFAGTCFGEDYPYFDPAYMWAQGHSTIVLLSFSVPSALQSRTIRSVVVNAQGGGCTLLEFGSEAPDYVPYPLYVNPWGYSGMAGYRFSTSKPSSPNAVGSAHTNVYFGDMTQAAVTAGAPIFYDSSGYWTMFSNLGQVNVYTPASVNSLCQGASKIWVCCWPTSVPAFSIPSNYSRAEHAQNARAGWFGLWIYA